MWIQSHIVSAIILTLSATVSLRAGDLDRGHKLLLQYGYQIHAGTSPKIIPDGNATHDQVNLSILHKAHFTGITFANCYWNKQMVTEPVGNYLWQRWWDFDPAQPPTAEINLFPDHPAQPGMIMASVGEELDLAVDATLESLTHRLEVLRKTAPDVIGYVNDAGGVPSGDTEPVNSLEDIKNFMRRAQPDMLCFDCYPFGFGNHWEGGSPTPMYNAMGRYRTAALAGNSGDSTRPIPYAMWINYGKSIAQNPPAPPISESEMNLQYGVAWAYGYTTLIGFRYSSEPHEKEHTQSTLFVTGYDDSPPTPLYTSVSHLNRQTLNLGPALLRLKSTHLLFVRGQHKNSSGAISPNILPEFAQDWSAQNSGNPYLTAITAANLGNPKDSAKINDGLPGDVIVGAFKVLDESFDGSATDQLYFMITNGLTDLHATGPEARQRISLKFDFGTSGITSLQRLNKNTGKIEVVPLVPTSPGATTYKLDLTLNGGEGDLFKYNTGAPFVGLQ